MNAPQLQLNGLPFSQGRTKYRDYRSEERREAKIYVPIQVDTMTTLAQLDTGADWSVLETEVAEALGLLNLEGIPINYGPPGDPCRGKLVPDVSILLEAADGESLELAATVFVSEEWKRHSFLGYQGLLQHVRIALDPTQNHLYFGRAEPE